MIPDLVALVREYPYREQLRGQLMLALYRAGRQTDALAQFQEARSALVETFGVEPARDLQEVHKAILRQDPKLDASRPRLPSEQVPPPVPARTRRISTLTGMSLALLIVLAIAAGALLLTRGGSAPRELASASLATIDGGSGSVSRVQRIDGYPTVVGVSGGNVWFGDGQQKVVREVRDDLRTRVRTIPLSTFPYRLVVGPTAAWVANGYEGTVERIDTATGRAIRISPDPRGLGRVQLALGAGALWAASQDGVLTRTTADGSASSVVATRIGRPEALAHVVASLPVGGQPTVVAAERGAVWAGLATGSLVRIDPKTDRVVQVISAGGPVSGLTISGDKVVATIS